MRKTFIEISASAFLLFSLCIPLACGNRTDGNAVHADTTMYDLAQEEGPGHDDARVLPPVEIDFGGKHYVTTVSISPSDSLPLVKDTYNDPYKDNEAKVRVTVDGKILLDKVFSKADFITALGNEVDPSSQIFCGIAFDKISARGIVFRAQVARPGDMEGGTSFFVTYPVDGGTPVVERDHTRETEFAAPD